MTSRQQVEQALDAHADELSAYPNVVGIGAHESAGRPRSHALAVYVAEKKPASELDAGDLLPGFVEITVEDETMQVPVTVIEIGEVHPEDTAAHDAEIRSIEGDDGSTFFAQ